MAVEKYDVKNTIIISHIRVTCDYCGSVIDDKVGDDKGIGEDLIVSIKSLSVMNEMINIEHGDICPNCSSLFIKMMTDKIKEESKNILTQMKEKSDESE